MGSKDVIAKEWHYLSADETMSAPWIVKKKRKHVVQDNPVDTTFLESFSLDYERLFSGLLLTDLLSVCLVSMVISQWVTGGHWPLYVVNLLTFSALALATKIYVLSNSQYMLGKFTVIIGASLLVESVMLFLFQVPASEIVCSLGLITGVFLVLAILHHGLTTSFVVSCHSGLYYKIECRIKRTFDWAMSLLLLGVMGPLFLLVMAGIFMFDRGPAIFKQTRIGLKGQDFTLFKFRSMVLNPNENQVDLETSKTLKSSKKILFKMDNDPRVTSWGRLLRSFSLDELPQLVNVIRGEMSLVGPRPPLPVEFNEMTERHRRKFEVSPGMTGLWQITGRVKNERNFDAVAQYDIDYIEKWSVFKDMTILLKTIPVVLGQKGAS